MASDPLTVAEEALRWVAGDYNECNAGGHESPPSELCVRHMAMDAARGLASVRARLAAAEAVVEAARLVMQENAPPSHSLGGFYHLKDALAAYDKARGTR